MQNRMELDNLDLRFPWAKSKPIVHILPCMVGEYTHRRAPPFLACTGYPTSGEVTNRIQQVSYGTIKVLKRTLCWYIIYVLTVNNCLRNLKAVGNKQVSRHILLLWTPRFKIQGLGAGEMARRSKVQSLGLIARLHIGPQDSLQLNFFHLRGFLNSCGAQKSTQANTYNTFT